MNTYPKPKRLTAKQALFTHHGIKPGDEDGLNGYLESIIMDSELDTACCEEGCTVEPDGTCPHGHPSILLALGMI